MARGTNVTKSRDHRREFTAHELAVMEAGMKERALGRATSAPPAPAPQPAGELTLHLRNLDEALDTVGAALATLEQMMCDVLAPAAPTSAGLTAEPQADSPAGQWVQRLTSRAGYLHAAVADLQARLRV